MNSGEAIMQPDPETSREAMSYPVHPLLSKVPLISAADEAPLRKGIKTHGLINPIVLWRGETIIDGRTRERICREEGIPAHYTEYRGPLSVAQYILQSNLRRNLTSEQRDAMIVGLAREAVPQMYEEAIQAKHNGRLKGAATPKKALHENACKAFNRKETTQQRFRKLVGHTRKADDAMTVIKHEDLASKVENGELSLRAAAQVAINRNKTPKLQNAGSEPHPALEERRKFDAEKLAIINAPSIYPLDAELPVHSQEHHTRYIQEAITELRREEPEIKSMSRGQLSKRIHVYTQRIQTYGKFGDAQRVTGPIDQRFVEWAGSCFLKLRAREAILEHHMTSPIPRPNTNGLKRKKGDEFDRLFKEVNAPFRRSLKPFPSQYEERFRTKVLEIIAEVFAEKREAHTKRLGLQTNGATAPLK